MTETPMIFKALNSVMSDVRGVAKRDRNNHANYNFRGIDAVVNAVGPALRTHEVLVVPQVQTVVYDQVQTSTGKPATACRVQVTYVFAATDGSTIEASVVGEAWDAGDKAAPKAMSVAFRTALLQALALPTDEPDPDSHTYERSAVELGPLHELIGGAKAAGLTGDYDATVAWAAESQANADAAARKLRNALDAAADDTDSSTVGGRDRPASVEAPTVEDPPKPADTVSPVVDGPSGEAGSTPVPPSPDTDYDWKTDAGSRKLGSADVLLAVRAAWDDIRAMLDVDGRKRWGAPPNMAREVSQLAEVCPAGVADALARWGDDGEPSP